MGLTIPSSSFCFASNSSFSASWFLSSLPNFFLIATLKLVLEFLLIQGVAHGEAIVLQSVFCFDLCLVCLILSSELFCLLYHAIDLGLRQTTLFIRYGDLI